jgi:hypothetical protein
MRSGRRTTKVKTPRATFTYVWGESWRKPGMNDSTPWPYTLRLDLREPAQARKAHLPSHRGSHVNCISSSNILRIESPRGRTQMRASQFGQGEESFDAIVANIRNDQPNNASNPGELKPYLFLRGAVFQFNPAVIYK